MAKKIISIITPCYNEELNVQDCAIAIRTLFQEKLPLYDYEHIFCDNASADKTVEAVICLSFASLLSAIGRYSKRQSE